MAPLRGSHQRHSSPKDTNQKEQNGFQSLTEQRLRPTRELMSQGAWQPIPESWTDHSEASKLHCGCLGWGRE